MGGKGEMIKAPIGLQELRRKLYAKAKAKPHWRFWGLSPETPGFRLGAVEYAVATRYPGAVQRLPGTCRSAKSPLGRIGPISRDTKQTGERSAGKPHAAFDVAGAGNVDHGRDAVTLGQPKGRDNSGYRQDFDLNRLPRQSSTLPLNQEKRG